MGFFGRGCRRRFSLSAVHLSVISAVLNICLHPAEAQMHFTSITLSSNGAGSYFSAILVFIPSTNLDYNGFNNNNNNGKLTLTFPTGYFSGDYSNWKVASNISLMTFANSAPSFSHSGVCSVSFCGIEILFYGAGMVASQAVTLTISSTTFDSSGGSQIRLGNARGATAAGFKISSYAETTLSNGLDAPAILSAANDDVFFIDPQTNYGAGSSVSPVLRFSPRISVPIGGEITLTMPRGYFLGTATFAADASSVTAMTGSSPAVTQNSDTIVLRIAGAETGCYIHPYGIGQNVYSSTVTLSGLTLGAPQAAGFFKLSTSQEAGTLLRRAPAILLAAAFGSISMLSNGVGYYPNKPVNPVFVFTPGVEIPIAGTITLAMPRGYFLGTAVFPPGASSVTLMTGSAPAVAEYSDSIILTITGAATGIGVAVTVTLSGLKLGPAQAAGFFTLSTSVQTAAMRQVAPAIVMGNWQIAQAQSVLSDNNWISSENPIVPRSGGQPLIMDVTARFIMGSELGQNFVTFAAGEAILLPLCNPGNENTIQDSINDFKITFGSTSTITVSILNAATGNLTFLIPTTQTRLLNASVRVISGYLKVLFPSHVYAKNSMIMFALTKLKVEPGIVCNSRSTQLMGSRGGETTMQQVGYFSFYPLLVGISTSNDRVIQVVTADFSDSRPSRLTRIRITAQNSLRRGSFTCSQTEARIAIQLPLYFGNRLNASDLTMIVVGSIQSKVTKLAFDPITFALTGVIIPIAVFSTCYENSLSSNFFVEISGLSTPRNSSGQNLNNLQLSMAFSRFNYGSPNLLLQVSFPAIETISNARITIGSSSASGLQFLVSFLTSFDVGNICGPGDISSTTPRIVLRVQGAVQMCSDTASATAKFISVPQNQPVSIGNVVLRLVGDTCEILLYLSSGDSSVGSCTPVKLPAPELPSAQIQFAINGLKIPGTPLPPLSVSIDVDDASPDGVRQTCSNCAEWPATPAFSGSVELPLWAQHYYYKNQFSSLVAIINDIGGIVVGDALTIQIPRGVSSTATLVCTGSKLNDASTTDMQKFDVLSTYPYLVLQWRIGNKALPDASVNVTCTAPINSWWSSNFDSAPSTDLIIQKESNGSSLRQIRTGFSPGRYLNPSMSAALIDQRPGRTTTFSMSILRGSFATSVFIPALGFSLIQPSNGAKAAALCSCISDQASNQACTTTTRAVSADLEMNGDYIKVQLESGQKFDNCNITVQNPNTAGLQGSAMSYIDGNIDYLYSAPSISSVGRASVTLSEYTLATPIQATIIFAHSTPLSTNSQLRLSGFCNFGQLGLSVSFASDAIKATASLSGCHLVIAVTSGTLEPPPSGSASRIVVSNLKTPAVRQAKSIVSVSTHLGSSSVAIDSCSECAFISEMPLFAATLSLSTATPGAASVEISIDMKNVWAPFTLGSKIKLAIPKDRVVNNAAFPGDWKGPASGFQMSVNGDLCAAYVSLNSAGLEIEHQGAKGYTALDMTIKLGPYYTVPRKLLKPFSLLVTKSQASNADSSLAVYPEITGSCLAGHSLNFGTNVCERCNNFRYNDGTMSECKFCLGQELGNSNLKATECVPFCPWPFEYVYSTSSYSGAPCSRDGGLCSNFGSGTQDQECECSSGNYYNNYGYNPASESAAAYRCQFVNLNANITVVATLFCLFILIFIACVFKLPSKPKSTIKEILQCKGKLLFLAFFPALDFLSDLVYILTSKFNNITIMLASVFFFLFPM